MDKPILYSFWASSCSWRVRIALAYKGIDYTLETVDFYGAGEWPPPEYLKINPLGQIPALITDGTTICDSLVIMEYLEEAYPAKPLTPNDIVTRTKVRHICQMISSYIQPLQNPTVAKYHSKDTKEQAEWIHHFITKGFTALEKVLGESAGKYCVGDTFTQADICLMPQVFNAEKRFKIDMKPYPTVMRIYQTLSELDIVKSTHPFLQPGCPPDWSR